MHIHNFTKISQHFNLRITTHSTTQIIDHRNKCVERKCYIPQHTYRLYFSSSLTENKNNQQNDMVYENVHGYGVRM